ncbi:MAG: hypothetical protein GTO63_13475, partial [Anaerolineae bacterium]|nr:hypothetical protein [Anaerolineae bacterium]NIN95858.1 hypothetical protein [Anaerolineae bacterium]NIQ78824.1 hypothetical protein [Anaerolineae bacterium]
IGVLIPPPGYNVVEYEKVAKSLESEVRHYWEAESPTERLIRYFYFVAHGREVFMAARAPNSWCVERLIPLMKQILGKVPG